MNTLCALLVLSHILYGYVGFFVTAPQITPIHLWKQFETHRTTDFCIQWTDEIFSMLNLHTLSLSLSLSLSLFPPIPTFPSLLPGDFYLKVRILSSIRFCGAAIGYIDWIYDNDVSLFLNASARLNHCRWVRTGGTRWTFLEKAKQPDIQDSWAIILANMSFYFRWGATTWNPQDKDETSTCFWGAPLIKKWNILKWILGRFEVNLPNPRAPPQPLGTSHQPCCLWKQSKLLFCLCCCCVFSS